jgi:hypothetical protein
MRLLSGQLSQQAFGFVETKSSFLRWNTTFT